MSKYTTGELAKLCGVSVRTVQYYDSRGILVPSAMTEGGRRLYSEEDLGKLKVICFLRGLDLPIESIRKLFAEEHPEKVIDLLLEEREKALREELAQRQAQAAQLSEVRRTLRQMPNLSTQTIGDVAHIMQTSRQLKKLRWTMLALALPLEVFEIASIFWWVRIGQWHPFALILAVEVIVGCWISRVYFTRVSYICPECHSVFKPKFWEAFFARHTFYTRKLTCTHCGHQGFCVETYHQEKPQC